MNNMPFVTNASGSSCPIGPPNGPIGYCWGAAQMGELPQPGPGGGTAGPESYTGGQIHWPTGLGHPLPLCKDSP